MVAFSARFVSTHPSFFADPLRFDPDRYVGGTRVEKEKRKEREAGGEDGRPYTLGPF